MAGIGWRIEGAWPGWRLRLLFLGAVIALLAPLSAARAEPPGPAREGAGWLAHLNGYRAMAGLPPVAEDREWSLGARDHARYMVKNDAITHSQDPGNPWYTSAGAAAAQTSNVMVHSAVDAADATALDMWMQGPFHALGIIDPQLGRVGFGSYREADGGYQMAAAVDVLRGVGGVPAGVRFPVKFPSGRQPVPLASYTGVEWPDPLVSCPGYEAPTGLPIILQVGDGSGQPSVGEHTLRRGRRAAAHCVFSEATYTNPDGNAQALVRSVLAARDAVVLIPKKPLEPGARYTVSLEVGGRRYGWSFRVAADAR